MANQSVHWTGVGRETDETWQSGTTDEISNDVASILQQAKNFRKDRTQHGEWDDNQWARGGHLSEPSLPIDLTQDEVCFVY